MKVKNIYIKPLVRVISAAAALDLKANLVFKKASS